MLQPQKNAVLIKMEQKQIEARYRIVDITLLSFQLEVLNQQQIDSLDKNKIAFELGLKFISANKGIVKLQLLTKFFADNTKSLPLGQMECEGDYEITNYNEITEAKLEPITDHVVLSFASSLVGTSRGFYILKVAETFLKGTIIPVVMMDTFKRMEIKG